ncbi:calcium/calmodulin-dependent 3',5'-cyclic nucleotide phosphodiesterase 1C, partial [Cyclospora cayetanensis]|uniref:Calcium/calmodulin-dependent 3',5'-cyclic nucleotide phosphodiesterase 1C n=1 Tax=Cyclospora cayetanensis TaxID=88456 RepID=A0A6P6RZ42_9EIME
MVIAALGHDVGHPGIGNSSLIASRNLCAIMFNERAVLESYHSFLLMELLRHPETDILEGFSAEVQQAARQRIVRAILATDPAFHFQLADELEALKAANPELNGPATLLDERIKDACLMRAADNAWVLTNFPLHRKWGERMVLELHFQNTLDEALKMPPSAPSVILPRDTCLATTMIHFIDNVFVPFYSILAWFFPGDLDTRVCVMQANSATWEKIRQESSKIEGSHDVEELKEMRLSGISAALKALEEEMEYQSAKLVIDESASPQLINCYQYDETPYRILLDEQQRVLEEQRRQQEELELQKELAFQAARREEEEMKLREEEERKAKAEEARRVKEQQEAEQQRREERRRRRAEMSSDSGSDSSVETTVTEEQQDHAVEKPRPSISPLAEGFRSMIERELSKSRRQSQDTKGKEGDGSPLAPTEGLSPLPSNVIDELEPDIEPEGPLGYEADVQAIAALLASKRIEAAAEGKEEDPQTNCSSSNSRSTTNRK